MLQLFWLLLAAERIHMANLCHAELTSKRTDGNQALLCTSVDSAFTSLLVDYIKLLKRDHQIFMHVDNQRKRNYQKVRESENIHFTSFQ